MFHQKKAVTTISYLVICALLLCGCTATVSQQAVAADGNAVQAIVSTEAEIDEVNAVLPTAVFPVNEPTGAENEIVVSTVDEFLAAIGSDRVIFMQPGEYTLTDAKDYGKASASSCYEWVETNDGFYLKIRDVENLSIYGHSANDVEINTVPRYADVIGFVDCRSIYINSITAGHTEGPGACSGAVLNFASTDTVSVRDCGLYGCGTHGLELWNCKDVTAQNCTIRDCSIGGMRVTDSKNVLCEDSRIVNCGTAAQPAEAVLYVAQSSAIAMVNCTVQSNTSRSLLNSAYCKDVQILGSLIQSNSITESAFALAQYSPVVEGCAFTDNTVAAWYADTLESGSAMQAATKAGAALSIEDLLDMQQADIPYEATMPATDNADQMPTPTPAESEATAAGDMREVHAENVDEFLAAIAPNTTVYLADGVYDLSKSANYGAYGGDNYYWVDDFDGPGLVIVDVSNFHIIGGGADKVSIHAIPRYADVISYEWCENVSVKGVTLGHSEAPGECCGGVLRFNDTKTVSVEDCVLFGCGILGIEAFECSSFRVDNTEIHDCSYGGVSLNDCRDMAFTHCNIHDCGEPMFKADRCENVTVDGKMVESTQN